MATDITTIDWTDHQNDTSSSLYSPDYTYSNDKYSCIRGFYFAHLVFNYLVFLSGIVCLATRVAPPRYKWLHSWFGRVYVLSMLWSTVTSLLMNNTGLPLSTIISFGAVMGGLTVGWIVIVVYRSGMDRKAQQLVQERLVEKTKLGTPPIGDTTDGGQEDLDLTKMLNDAKMDIVNSKTFVQRFFSLKALHGILFFTSWMQITGRIFASNQSGDFTCHTYPVYKPIDAPQVPEGAEDELTIVPTTDPDYDRLPWAAAGPVAWTMQIILGSMFGAIVVGGLVSWRASVKAQRISGESRNSSSADSSEIVDEEDTSATKDKDVRSSRRATLGMTNDHVPNVEKFSDEEEE
mmetsp:Transcript_34690/g.101958  ORF Transcript_34690/g.101958 Transcript_34690/m.101958 type:complete len:348 (-) Transcript_34690:110-1153(-)